MDLVRGDHPAPAGETRTGDHRHQAGRYVASSSRFFSNLKVGCTSFRSCVAELSSVFVRDRLLGIGIGIYIFLSEYIQLHEFFIDRTV